MNEFKREERFIVIKRKHLSAESRVHDSLEQELRVWLDKHLIPTSECVVVESDWPEYETVWSMIAARVEGRPTPYQVIEQQVAALRQHKNDYMEAAEETRRALEAEAQALREEVAAYEDGMRSLACSLGAGGFNAETLTAAQLVEKVQWGVDNFVETQGRQLDEIRSERDALRARVVMVPERVDPDYFDSTQATGVGWNACLDELARLNGKVVSEGLLRRACAEHPATCCMDDEAAWRKDRDEALIELRALLGEGKEVGDGCR